MPAAYKVSCNEKKPQICRTKLQAFNYAKLYRALDYTDVLVTEATRDGKGEEEVMIGDKRISACSDMEVILDDMLRCRNILRQDAGKRRCVAQHLAAEAAPLSSGELPKGTDPKAYTVDQVIIPLLTCLGYTKSNYSKNSDGPDMLIKLKGFSFVLDAGTFDSDTFEKDSVRIIGDILENESNKGFGGIYTDGRRWLFAMVVNDRPVNSGLMDLREPLRLMLSKDADVNELTKYAGLWKYFTEYLSADTIIASARTMQDNFTKQMAVEVKAD
ncbi:MAG: hypothetical protein J5707_01475, partial [Candidatus Methanomethylophilus sp.]|nr:hypothetical protein [Methanomethylophilus sp.]